MCTSLLSGILSSVEQLIIILIFRCNLFVLGKRFFSQQHRAITLQPNSVQAPWEAPRCRSYSYKSLQSINLSCQKRLRQVRQKTIRDHQRLGRLGGREGWLSQHILLTESVKSAEGKICSCPMITLHSRRQSYILKDVQDCTG